MQILIRDMKRHLPNTPKQYLHQLLQFKPIWFGHDTPDGSSSTLEFHSINIVRETIERVCRINAPDNSSPSLAYHIFFKLLPAHDISKFDINLKTIFPDLKGPEGFHEVDFRSRCLRLVIESANSPGLSSSIASTWKAAVNILSENKLLRRLDKLADRKALRTMHYTVHPLLPVAWRSILPAHQTTSQQVAETTFSLFSLSQISSWIATREPNQFQHCVNLDFANILASASYVAYNFWQQERLNCYLYFIFQILPLGLPAYPEYHPVISDLMEMALEAFQRNSETPEEIKQDAISEYSLVSTHCAQFSSALHLLNW
jgi:hypothetical protein